MSYSSAAEPDLAADAVPIYNIKAVAEATGLSAATLRAWERRYGALAPGRTESGYRLYSARDIAALRWLKARVDQGMSISQAIQLFLQSSPGLEPNPLAEPAKGSSETRAALLAALTRYDEAAANRLLEEAFAIYGVEAGAESILAPAIAQLGEMWRQGEATIASEHFATNYLRRKLDAIINAAPQPASGPLVVMGCAPGDWHELGLLLIYLMLRRRNINTIYLGQNVALERFAEDMARLKAAVVVMSATTAETLPGLIAIGEAAQSMGESRPIFGFGGRIFSLQPELRTRVPGVFLGESARGAVEHIISLLEVASAERAATILKMPHGNQENP